ncbi:flagellin [Dasania sp. GY-MA-18]|uniref:Flagellin n=1 Tax=Dasania phycosphaerae TaxID=2950436 RepID=A0A9J6RHP1_9GAMM|nr:MULTISPECIES: flagellin [Dasania]MCR8921454.1 flagellin [Dasania sp. GY-MA-18]MCZ0863882.1 flagellin [Dasania phycosphaerae]MCZ0867610.1 flagellin [Dasania phycosphaerae]
MGLTIGEIASNESLLNQLQKNAKQEREGLQPLSSGKKINSAKDDAAGLIISQQLLTELNALDQTARNASDGISLVQVADGGLSSINDNLSRIRELSLQASNGTLGNSQRDAIQAEVGQLQEQISTVLDTTQFNDLKLLQSNATIELQVGGLASDKLSLQLPDLGASLTPAQAIDVSTGVGASNALAVIDTAIDAVNSFRGDLGAVSKRIESVISNNRNSAENTAAARSRINDTDFALATSEQLKQSLLKNSGNALQAQANASSQLVLSLLS